MKRMLLVALVGALLLCGFPTVPSERRVSAQTVPVPTRVTNHPAADTQPAFSPDGSRIVFISDRDSNPGDVYVMNADGTGVTRLTNTPADETWPKFSPDGSRIAFASRRTGSMQVYVMNADGSNQVQLTTSAGDNLGPEWSPDGRRIYFHSYRNGSAEIYVMNADGTSEIRVTFNLRDNHTPNVSPDGTRIAFHSFRDGNHEIYIMNADGTNQVNLSNNPAQENEADFHADGRRLVFDSNRDGNFELYMMNVDGTSVTRLTNNPARDTYARFSRDGQRIVFTSNRDGNDEIYVMATPGAEPVVLVPGITGSELQLEQNHLWLDVETNLFLPCALDSADLLAMQMSEDGTSIRSPINATNYVDLQLGRFALHPYSLLVDSLRRNYGFPVYAFPYDWRLRVGDNALALASFVAQVKTQTGATRVNIVAHSQGGLVAKEFASRNPGDVNRLILVAVPHLGSPKAFKALRYGDHIHWFLSLCGDTIFKRAVHNMPALYQLLPSRLYFERGLTTTADPRYFDDQADVDNNNVTGPADATSMEAILRGALEVINPLGPEDPAPRQTLSATLVNAAIEFHTQERDLWSAPPRTHSIIGYNGSTISRIREYESLLGRRDYCFYNMPHGDGTVPMWSAEAVRGDRKYWYDSGSGEAHATILSDQQIITQIANILQDRPETGGSRITGTRPAITRNLWTLCLGSPADLHIFDAQNRHTGKDPQGFVEQGVPDTSIDRMDTGQVISGGASPVRVVVTSRGIGFANLQVHEVRGTTATRVITYLAVPINERTRFSVDYAWGATAPNLQVDNDGNGTVDFTLRPTQVVAGPLPQQVVVDIKPGSSTNPVNLLSEGVLTVALLSTASIRFDQVDAASVRFGPLGASEIHGRAHVEDVNGDGRPDLVFHFNLSATGITTRDTAACLQGRRLDGRPFQGCDVIRVFAR